MNGGGGRTKTIGSSVGSTENVVGLGESAGLLAKIDVEHELIFDLVHEGERTRLAVSNGQATLGFAADLLPAEDPQNASVGSLPAKVAARATLLHMDVPGILDAAGRVLPRGMREDSVAFHHFANFLNSRSLVAHPQWLVGAYGTEAGIRPQGMPTRSALSVTGDFGEAEVLGAVDYVSGRIKFGLGSAGIFWGGSSNVSVGASISATDLDNGGTTNDGGRIGLPSRSSGTGETRSQLDIWGTEELTIETGKHYFLRVNVDLGLTGSESVPIVGTVAGRLPVGESRQATAQGTA